MAITFNGTTGIITPLSANTVATVDLGTATYTDAIRVKSGTEAAGNPFLYLKKDSATSFTMGGYGATAEGSLNLSFPSGVATTGTVTTPNVNLNGAWNAANSGGQIFLNGSTGNRIEFAATGLAAPANTTRSSGTRMVLYPAVDATNVDYAMGMETSNMWQSVPNTTAGFKWYAGTNNVAQLLGDGTMDLINSTSGAGTVPGEQTFRLTAAGTAITTIANFFGATSAISLEAASMYEITYYCRFLKTTAGTVTWTLTASSAPTQVSARYIQTPITGTGGVGVIGTITSAATAATAFAATGSLTTAVQHFFEIKAYVNTNAACNLRLNLACAAGSATPQAGSFYTVKKISTTTGTFVA